MGTVQAFHEDVQQLSTIPSTSAQTAAPHVGQDYGCEVLAEEEVKQVFADLDSNGSGALTLNEFSIWMVSRLTEPGHTKEEVLSAFEDIAQYPPVWPSLAEVQAVVTTKRIECVFRYKPASRDQILEESKECECLNHEEEKSFNYGKLTENLFSR